MKILVTGKVKSGKTTLVTTLLESIPDKQGMVTAELVEGDQRVAFDMQDSSGRVATLARTDHKTDVPVGRFFVDLASLDSFVGPLFTFDPNQLLYIDEIGQMQLHSDQFQQLVLTYLDAPNDYLGTISNIYEHPFINAVKNRQDVLLCTITPENRDDMLVALTAALKNRTVFNSLAVTMQAAVVTMARDYLESGAYISVKKLFNNAIVYVAEDRVKATTPHAFVVHGNHDERQVEVQGDNYSCDCDFFNGRGQFAGKAGECSHIQAVKILS